MMILSVLRFVLLHTIEQQMVPVSVWFNTCTAQPPPPPKAKIMISEYLLCKSPICTVVLYSK